MSKVLLKSSFGNFFRSIGKSIKYLDYSSFTLASLATPNSAKSTKNVQEKLQGAQKYTLNVQIVCKTLEEKLDKYFLKIS